MKLRKSFLFAALPLLSLCSSCTGKTSPRKLRLNYTGDLVGEYKQSKLGPSIKREGETIKDQKFVFSVKITAEDNVIKQIGWNEENKNLLYTKNKWLEDDVKIIKETSQDFFNLFVGLKFEKVYYTLIAHSDNIPNPDNPDQILYPASQGCTVRYDSLTFDKGTNDSPYSLWSSGDYVAPEGSNIKEVGRLVEIGAIMSIYHAITN